MNGRWLREFCITDDEESKILLEWVQGEEPSEMCFGMCFSTRFLVSITEEVSCPL